MRMPSVMGQSDWHVWRNAGIGSSDVATILGYSPFDNPARLLCEKAGLVPKRPLTPYIERGLKLEPIAREMFNRRHGMELRPANFVHDEYSWLRASIDGVDDDNSIMIEIKCPGRVSALNYINHGIPIYYAMQMHHASFVSGIGRAIFVVMYECELYESDVTESPVWSILCRCSDVMHSRKAAFYNEMVALKNGRGTIEKLIDEHILSKS